MLAAVTAVVLVTGCSSDGQQETEAQETETTATEAAQTSAEAETETEQAETEQVEAENASGKYEDNLQSAPKLLLNLAAR